MASSVTSEAISHAFRRAAERSRSFAHPDYLPIIGTAEQSGLPVAVTMLPDGEALSERITERPVPLADAMKQVSQIAHAVSAVHAAGWQHGYLVPSNLWVREDGRVALLDGGLHAAAAHATFSSGFPISPSPYAPEVDDAYTETNLGTDVYSLVVLLLRLVTGRLVPSQDLPAAVAALPDVLPASLRTELADAVKLPRPATAPVARSLAVHLAFDTAWIRAQERSRRDREVVEGEVLKSEQPAHDPWADAGERVGPGTLAAGGSHVRPAAGIRGGATAGYSRSGSITAPVSPWLRMAEAGRGLAGSARQLLSRASLHGPRHLSAPVPPLIASYSVRLGPFPDAPSATAVRARVRHAWPMAAVIADQGSYFVQVTTCANRGRAEEAAERLRANGEPVQVSTL
jgi:hypothetical protein